MNNLVNRILVATAIVASLAFPSLAQGTDPGAKMSPPDATTKGSVKKSVKSSKPAKDAKGIKADPAAPAKLKAGEGTVNVNKATLEELIRVPGIGNATAERILEVRKTAGKFAEMSDLTTVKGIGDKKLARLKPYLTL